MSKTKKLKRATKPKDIDAPSGRGPYRPDKHRATQARMVRPWAPGDVLRVPPTMPFNTGLTVTDILNWLSNYPWPDNESHDASRGAVDFLMQVNNALDELGAAHRGLRNADALLHFAVPSTLFVEMPPGCRPAVQRAQKRGKP